MAKLKPWYQVVTPREDLRELLQTRGVGDESEHPLTALCVHGQVGLRHDALDEPLLAHSIDKKQQRVVNERHELTRGLGRDVEDP